MTVQEARETYRRIVSALLQGKRVTYLGDVVTGVQQDYEQVWVRVKESPEFLRWVQVQVGECVRVYIPEVDVVQANHGGECEAEQKGEEE